MYGRLHLPTCRLDALYTRRISPSLQALATLVSIPASTPFTAPGPISSTGQDPLQAVFANAVSPFWNLMLGLSHDTGRWSQQYTYSTDDGLFGARVLHNFSPSIRSGCASTPVQKDDQESDVDFDGGRIRLVDEEEIMDNVLKGRFSAGAEIYFSAQAKSAGGECS